MADAPEQERPRQRARLGASPKVAGVGSGLPAAAQAHARLTRMMPRAASGPPTAQGGTAAEPASQQQGPYPSPRPSPGQLCTMAAAHAVELPRGLAGNLAAWGPAASAPRERVRLRKRSVATPAAGAASAAAGVPGADANAAPAEAPVPQLLAGGLQPDAAPPAAAGSAAPPAQPANPRQGSSPARPQRKRTRSWHALAEAAACGGAAAAGRLGGAGNPDTSPILQGNRGAADQTRSQRKRRAKAPWTPSDTPRPTRSAFVTAAATARRGGAAGMAASACPGSGGPGRARSPDPDPSLNLEQDSSARRRAPSARLSPFSPSPRASPSIIDNLDGCPVGTNPAQGIAPEASQSVTEDPADGRMDSPFQEIVPWALPCPPEAALCEGSGHAPVAKRQPADTDSSEPSLSRRRAAVPDAGAAAGETWSQEGGMAGPMGSPAGAATAEPGSRSACAGRDLGGSCCRERRSHRPSLGLKGIMRWGPWGLLAAVDSAAAAVTPLQEPVVGGALGAPAAVRMGDTASRAGSQPGRAAHAEGVAPRSSPARLVRHPASAPHAGGAARAGAACDGPASGGAASALAVAMREGSAHGGAAGASPAMGGPESVAVEHAASSTHGADAATDRPEGEPCLTLPEVEPAAHAESGALGDGPATGGTGRRSAAHAEGGARGGTSPGQEPLSGGGHGHAAVGCGAQAAEAAGGVPCPGLAGDQGAATDLAKGPQPPAAAAPASADADAPAPAQLLSNIMPTEGAPEPTGPVVLQSRVLPLAELLAVEAPPIGERPSALGHVMRPSDAPPPAELPPDMAPSEVRSPGATGHAMLQCKAPPLAELGPPTEVGPAAAGQVVLQNDAPRLLPELYDSDSEVEDLRGGAGGGAGCGWGDLPAMAGVRVRSGYEAGAAGKPCTGAGGEPGGSWEASGVCQGMAGLGHKAGEAREACTAARAPLALLHGTGSPVLSPDRWEASPAWQDCAPAVVNPEELHDGGDLEELPCAGDPEELPNGGSYMQELPCDWQSPEELPGEGYPEGLPECGDPEELPYAGELEGLPFAGFAVELPGGGQPEELPMVRDPGGEQVGLPGVGHPEELPGRGHPGEDPTGLPGDGSLAELPAQAVATIPPPTWPEQAPPPPAQPPLPPPPSGVSDFASPDPSWRSAASFGTSLVSSLASGLGSDASAAGKLTPNLVILY